MRLLNTLALVAFAGLVAVFCFQNFRTVEVDFLRWRVQAPLPFVSILIYILGMLSGWAVLSFLRKSYRAAVERNAN